MTKQSKREYIAAMRQRYLAAPKQEQTELLNEMITLTGWNRKYLIRVLHRKPDPAYPKAVVAGTPKPVRGRPKEYTGEALVHFLVALWHATGQACGKRLQSIIPLWLPWYRNTHDVERKTLSFQEQVLATRISAATIDRLLAEERSKHRIGKGRCTTKPGTLSLKQRIPIKTEQWQERRPGFLENDTVAHCGTSLQGQFAYSLDAVDLASGWTEAAAAWGKGEKGILEAFSAIEKDLPFPLRGMDSDNGGEFINYHMHTYLRLRPKGKKIQQTRAREYKKNDNAHIEQKNWTHIRQLFGYQRFDNPAVVPLMNDLYRNEYRLLVNYFLPSVKLKTKERIGSRVVKQHSKPMTPVDRLLAMRSIPDAVKALLRATRDSVNPFLLHQAVQRKRKIILAMATLAPASASQPPKASSHGASRTNKKRRTTRHLSLPAQAPAPAAIPGLTRKRKCRISLSSKNR